LPICANFSASATLFFAIWSYYYYWFYDGYYLFPVFQYVVRRRSYFRCVWRPREHMYIIWTFSFIIYRCAVITTSSRLRPYFTALLISGVARGRITLVATYSVKVVRNICWCLLIFRPVLHGCWWKSNEISFLDVLKTRWRHCKICHASKRGEIPTLTNKKRWKNMEPFSSYEGEFGVSVPTPWPDKGASKALAGRGLMRSADRSQGKLASTFEIWSQRRSPEIDLAAELITDWSRCSR
jgi:hypothetical protein